jgi:RNA polymerase sigma-70 factor (ECF subfamily)
MTPGACLPGSTPLAVNRPGPAAVLKEPVFMDKATEDTQQKHAADERRWSRFMVSAQAGNESDYRQLLTELSNVIAAFLRNRFGNHHFIEDCVQETLLAIHQARHTYDQRRRFRPWMFAIVRHKTIDILRKQSTRQKTMNQYQGQQEILSQGGQQNEAENEMIKGRLLESLPQQHREVLVLTKFIGFSVAETAKKLEISESLVKVRAHRAIRKLKQMMEADKP